MYNYLNRYYILTILSEIHDHCQRMMEIFSNFLFWNCHLDYYWPPCFLKYHINCQLPSICQLTYEWHQLPWIPILPEHHFHTIICQFVDESLQPQFTVKILLLFGIVGGSRNFLIIFDGELNVMKHGNRHTARYPKDKDIIVNFQSTVDCIWPSIDFGFIIRTIQIQLHLSGLVWV